MYKMIFVSDDGRKFVFGPENSNVFDADIGNGVSVYLGTSQGFSQFGETLESKTAQGRTIKVSGCFYGENIPHKKSEMRRVLNPLARGKLVFEDYEIRVNVKSSPTFSPVLHNGRFSFQFFAPYPFFKSAKKSTVTIGDVKPKFKFPVNYANPHKFGEINDEKYVNVINDGDVPVPFEIYIKNEVNDHPVENVTLVNLMTFKRLAISGSLGIGETVHIYRDDNGVLHAETELDGETTDIISRITEDSELFELDVGDNLIGVEVDEKLYIRLMYNPAVVNVYESKPL